LLSLSAERSVKDVNLVPLRGNQVQNRVRVHNLVARRSREPG
jgi:hypothetical protein